MENIKVSVVMGSDSDLPIMKEALATLDEFKIPYETIISSAHRSPEITTDYAKNLVKRGVKVVIASAGMAAHLAGVVAAHFPGPVIGVPISSGALEGIDALYSIVQMPPGIPVATVSINGAKNAALLAIQILAINDNKLMNQMAEYKKNLSAAVVTKNEKLNKIGIEKYLETVKK